MRIGGLRSCLGVVVVVGCAGARPPGGDDDAPPPPPPTCGGELPGFATAEAGTLHASCGDIVVRVRPVAGGLIELTYLAAGAMPRPSFAVVAADTGDATIGGDGGNAVVCTETLSVSVDDTCRVRAQLPDGTVIADDAEPFAVDGSARLVRVANHDRVYGLGEKTGGLDKRGRVWTMWNTDPYDPVVGGWRPGQDPLYQSIPFEVRVDGGVAHGVFTDETRKLTYDLGATVPSRDAIVAIGARSLRQYLIAGPRMADVVDRYTKLTGRPALPPRWALGFHQSRWGYSAPDVEAVAQRFRNEGIPVDALWLDIQHHSGFRTFTIDSAYANTASRLAQLGIHTVAIADPGIKAEPGWDVYDSGVAGGHFLKTSTGIYQGTAWPGASAFPDFSRAETRTWWGEHVGTLAARGIDGVWLDVNEPTTFPEGGGGNSVPDELAVAGDGVPTTMAELHNAYALLEAKATFEALGPRPFVLSRAGYAGIQRYAAVWTGDTPSTWDGLQQTLPMLLGLGVSGVPIVGSDIGGYSGNATGELYARWLALGSISPFSRAHVTQNVPGQEPWMFGAEVTDAARDLLRDRYRLLPYLYSLADEAARTGAPILRPLVWEFPDDPMVGDLGDQAMLGPYVLAAPVLDPQEGPGATTTRVVYLPAGRWYELHSGAIIDGPTTIQASLATAALPLYVREGAILPSWRDGDPSALELDVYPAAEPTGFTLYEDPGSRTRLELVAHDDGAALSITHDGAPAARTLTVRVHRVDGTVTGVDGADAFTVDPDARALVATVTDGQDLALRFHYDPAIADPRPPVAVTIEVRVPTDTPGTIHVASSATGWTHVPLAWVGAGVARGTIEAPRGEWFEYKITRGGWETVEKQANCAEVTNRARFGAAGSRTITVANWRDRCGN